MKPPIASIPHDPSRAEVVDRLRRLLPRMEGLPAETSTLSFGIAGLDSHLPQGGLAFGALHEIAPETDGDMPAAFGFIAALLGRMPQNGPVLLVTSPHGLADYGHPHGHGLNGLGLDPARVILVETGHDLQTFWALEEALRSGVPAAVAGAIETKLDLRTSQRLQLAAKDSGIPLLVLRPASAPGSSVAVTRWRVAAAAAARDRFGLIARWCWRLTLERCRNGRPGEWLVEFDHVAYRFSLAAAMADPALSQGAGSYFCIQAGRS